MRGIVFVGMFAVANALAAPVWLDNAGKECGKDEICQVGSGETQAAASRDARSNIAKYFEVSVNSRFSSSARIGEARVEEMSSVELEESVDSILKATTIKETYRDREMFYSFAVLDKTKLTNELRHDIEKIDDKMQFLLKDGKIGGTLQLRKMYSQREELNKRYVFLTDSSVPERIKYSEIYGKKDSDLSFYISLSNDKLENEDSIKQVIAGVVNDAGYAITDNKENAARIISVKITYKKMFLAIDGFEKYKVLYHVECKKGDTSVGILAKEYTETGRALEQIIEKTNEQFREFFGENYDKLLK